MSSILDRARKYVDSIPGAVSGQGGHDQTFTVVRPELFGLDDAVGFSEPDKAGNSKAVEGLKDSNQTQNLWDT